MKIINNFQDGLTILLIKVAELKQEAGKISNVELQRKVVRVFYYLCVVTLQYIAPMILILYLSFLYKTLGGGSWSGRVASESPKVDAAAASTVTKENDFQEVEVTPEQATTEDMEIGIGKIIHQEEAVEAITHSFSLAWISLKKVINILINQKVNVNMMNIFRYLQQMYIVAC